MTGQKDEEKIKTGKLILLFIIIKNLFTVRFV